MSVPTPTSDVYRRTTGPTLEEHQGNAGREVGTPWYKVARMEADNPNRFSRAELDSFSFRVFAKSSGSLGKDLGASDDRIQIHPLNGLVGSGPRGAVVDGWDARSGEDRGVHPVGYAGFGGRTARDRAHRVPETAGHRRLPVAEEG